MSRIDDHDAAVRACERLRRSIPALTGLRPSDVDVKLSEVTPEARALLCEMLARPEAARLLEAVLEERVAAARDSAIAECQEFLRRHVVEEVMEG